MCIMKIGLARWGLPAVALAVAPAFAQAIDETDNNLSVTLPSGVRISREYVNLTMDDRDKSHSGWVPVKDFPHGNVSIRIHATNSGDSAQRLEAEIPFGVVTPFRIAYRSHMMNCGKALTFFRLLADTEVAPGSDLEWNIPVPFLRGAGACSNWYISDGCGTLDMSNAYFSPEGYANRKALPLVALSRSLWEDGFRQRCARAVTMRAMHARNISDEDADKFIATRGARMAFAAPDFANFRSWRELSVYTLLAVDAKDALTMPERFWEILPDWIAAGGCFVLAGEPEEGSPAALSRLPDGEFGLGTVLRTDRGLTDRTRFADAMNAAFDMFSPEKHLRLVCDRQATAKINDLGRRTMPFVTLVLVLIAFCIVAGPVALGILAKKNKRINILWVFPLLSLAFSVAVAAVIVNVFGVNPELHQFAYTMVDEKAGKVVTVQTDVIFAPFPLRGEISYPSDGLVGLFSDSDAWCGEDIRCNGRETAFSGDWVPSLWPVAFRTVRVRNLEDGPEPDAVSDSGKDLGLLTAPIKGPMLRRRISQTVERRKAE